MIHLTRGLIRRWLDVLLHIQDSPERTAAAFALGVFFGFSPFLGFHTLLGVYSNLPWFLAPYYAIATMVGAEITKKRIPPNFRSQLGQLFELSLFHENFWHRLVVVMRPLFWPYTVGSMLCAVMLATVAYHLALIFVTSRRRIHDIIQHHHRD